MRPFRPLTTAAVLSMLLAACADRAPPSAGVAPETPRVGVTVAPTEASVPAGGRVAFTALVANAADPAVTWAVTGTSCGTITQAGLYTAPSSAGTCGVVVTSQEDATKSASAVVTVNAPVPVPVTVAVTPSPAAADACKTVTFTARVTGAANSAVTWSVQEGAAGGTITPAGVYTAPSVAGTYHVVATSNADPTKASISAVTITARVLSIAVSPPTTSVAPGGTVQFTATITTTCGTFLSTRALTFAGG